MVISAREKNLRGIGSAWVGNFVIFVRVTKEGLNEKMAVETWKRQGSKPGKRIREVQGSWGRSVLRVFKNSNQGNVAGAEWARVKVATTMGEVRRVRRPKCGESSGSSEGLGLLLWLRCKINGGLMHWTILPRGFYVLHIFFKMY